jgi:hypothetical protein
MKEMEMPCPWNCGDWFELYDGKPSLLNSSIIICEKCAQEELNSEITISDLRKDDTFTHYGDEYTVLTRFLKKNECLIALDFLNREKNFYDPDEIVYKF